MDLILSLSIEKIGEPSKEQVLESVEMDWLQNANADLMKLFNSPDTEEKIAEITQTAAIKVDHLDIGYEGGQYYVLDRDTPHALHDNDKIHLPGYRVTVHIRNNDQTNLLNLDTRYSEQLMDFDHLLIASDPLNSNVLHTPGLFEGANQSENKLGYYFDLPNMIGEEQALPQRSIEHDRENFHRPLAVPQKPGQEGNILETLGIYELSDSFFKNNERNHTMRTIANSPPFYHLDEIYDETHRDVLAQPLPSNTKFKPEFAEKPHFRQRLTYLKKAIIGE